MNPAKKPASPAARKDKGPKFSEMSTVQKCAHVGKVVLCVISFGILFPNVIG